MIILVDNYDSFSYNLYQMIGAIEPDIKVVRNDEYDASEILAMHPDRIILSPGPGRPEDAGNCGQIVRELAGKVPILGVCLGHQVICQQYGANVTYAKQLMHGKTSVIQFDKEHVLFDGLKDPVQVARYHSLAADPDTIPDCLKVTSVTEDGEVMSVVHKEYPVYGFQFHPESILTPQGHIMLENFIHKEL